jgi:hypothetical protein
MDESTYALNRIILRDSAVVKFAGTLGPVLHRGEHCDYTEI